MTDEPKIDFKALAEEAAASTYNPRAKRCWLLHQWSMWETPPDQRTQGRRCLKCGKIQRNTLEKVHTHKWTTYETRDVYNSTSKRPIAVAHLQRCDQCGEIRRRDLA